MHAHETCTYAVTTYATRSGEIVGAIDRLVSLSLTAVVDAGELGVVEHVGVALLALAMVMEALVLLALSRAAVHGHAGCT